MHFAILNLRMAEDDSGLEPDRPDGVSFLLLADLPQVNWGLYQLDTNLNDGTEWSPPDTVSEELEALLLSGMKYPPALALARGDIRRRFQDLLPTKVEFASAYTAILRLRLSQQATAPFVLARCVREQLGYLTVGEWYWLLSVTGDPGITSWVSDDYFIYNDHAAYFELTERQLSSLRLHPTEAAQP